MGQVSRFSLRIERKILLGLAKLVEDECEFEGGDAEHAADLRRELFSLAAERRRDDEAPFDRASVLAEIAAARGVEASALEAMLYADLRGAQRLVACRAPDAAPVSIRRSRTSR